MNSANLKILNAVPTHIAIVDADGIIQWVNDAWKSFASRNGASKSIAEGQGIHYLEVCGAYGRYREKDLKLVTAGIANVLSGAMSMFKTDYPCATLSNSLWFEMTVLPLSSDAPGVMISHFDITERKKVESTRAGFDQIFQQSLNEIFIFDAETLRFLEINTGARNNLGYSREELLKLTPVNIKPQYSYDDFQLLIEPLRRGDLKRLEFETVHERKDGSTYPAEIHLQFQEFEGRPVFVAIVLDLTERYTNSAALAQARLFLNSAPDAMIIVDDSGSIVSANSQAEKLFLYSGNELQNMKVEDLVPERFRHSHISKREGFGSKPRVRGMGAGRELYAVKKDGSEIPIEVSLSPIKTSTGLLAAAAIRDVTQQRQDAAILKAAKETAESATQTKTRFLAAASHDLRQPLQSIGLYLSALTRLLDQPKAIEISSKIRASLDSMESILEALLDISKLDSGAITPEIRVFPIQDLFDSLIADNLPLARQKGIALRCVDSDLLVESDPRLLERIIVNLVSNAIRYTKTGYVEMECTKHDTFVEIAIHDTGIGIPREKQDLIFDEYYQVGNDARDREKGLGLGLSIVKNLARVLEHPLSVESKEGAGSVFTVTVPAAQSDNSVTLPAHVSGNQRQESDRKPVVLFVEDDPAITDGIREFFDMLDMDLYCAESGDEALEHLAKGISPDILVSDYRLPNYSGLEVVAKVREQVSETLPAVIMTGDTSSKEIEAAGLSHCVVLHKPVNIDELVAHIEKVTA